MSIGLRNGPCLAQRLEVLAFCQGKNRDEEKRKEGKWKPQPRIMTFVVNVFFFRREKEKKKKTFCLGCWEVVGCFPKMSQGPANPEEKQ